MKRIWITFHHNHSEFYGQVEEEQFHLIGQRPLEFHNVFLLRQFPQKSNVSGADGRQMQGMGLGFSPFESPLESKVEKPVTFNTSQFLCWSKVESRTIIETLAQALLTAKQTRTGKNPPKAETR